jgi:hypothetical protein
LEEAIAQNLEKERREGWCDGGGDDATFSGGVSTRKKRGKCSPSTLGIVGNKR